MQVFPIGIEHALDVAIQRAHDSDARHNCRPVLFGDQDQAFHRRLPLWRAVFGLRKLRDVVAGILERDKLAAAGERNGIIERTFPTLPGFQLAAPDEDVRPLRAAVVHAHLLTIYSPYKRKVLES